MKFESGLLKALETRDWTSFYASNSPRSWQINFDVENWTIETVVNVDRSLRRDVAWLSVQATRSRADYYINDRVLGSEQALNLNLVHRVQRQKYGSATDRQRPRGVSHGWINTETEEPTNFRTKCNLYERNSRIRFLLEKFCSAAILGDAPHVRQTSVEVVSGDSEDASDSGEHQYPLEHVGDEDSLDTTHGRVEGANQTDQQHAHVPR